MEYNIAIGPDVRSVEIDSSGSSGAYEFVASVKNGKRGEIKVRVLLTDKNHLILSVGDRIFSVIQTERNPSAVEFIVNGRTIKAKIHGSDRKNNTSSLLATESELISSNFPAKVIKIPVKSGDELQEGDTLVILEAMKMEAQIKAPHQCTVEEVFIKEGELVERGKRMIRLKFR